MARVEGDGVVMNGAIRRRAGILGPAAGVMVVVYLCLALTATVCMTTHAGHDAGAHDHGSQPVHSLLCVWACQAGSPDGLSIAAPSPAALRTFLAGGVFMIVFRSLFSSDLIRSRAPPR